MPRSRSIAELLTAQEISLSPFNIENSMTIRPCSKPGRSTIERHLPAFRSTDPLFDRRRIDFADCAKTNPFADGTPQTRVAGDCPGQRLFRDPQALWANRGGDQQKLEARRHRSGEVGSQGASAARLIGSPGRLARCQTSSHQRLRVRHSREASTDDGKIAKKFAEIFWNRLAGSRKMKDKASRPMRNPAARDPDRGRCRQTSVSECIAVAPL